MDSYCTSGMLLGPRAGREEWDKVCALLVFMVSFFETLDCNRHKCHCQMWLCAQGFLSWQMLISNSTCPCRHTGPSWLLHDPIAPLTVTHIAKDS